jgi:phosphoribosylformylglycinamidine synthase PurS subunit
VQARVIVSLKRTVLDPQGLAIRNALVGLGHGKIQDVRQGKIFEIEFEAGEDLDAIAREVLTNPVIEDYQIEYL